MLQYVEQTAHEWVASPLQGEGKVRVLFKAPIPLTLILSPQARGEATKMCVTSLQLLKADNQ
jgi:hypothetical protein